MYRILIIFICIFYITSNSNASSRGKSNYQIYDIKDLKFLKNENSYQEFFEHAKDVKPGKRDEAWNNLVRSMAMAMLQDKMESIKITDRDFSSVLNISSWPSLKSNEFFKRKRDQLAYKYYKKCFITKSLEICYKEMKSYYIQFSLSPELGLKLANLLIDNNDISKILTLKLWPFIKPMSQSAISEFYCNKPPMKNLLINKLYKDIKTNTQTNEKIHKDCLKSITPGLKENLFTTGNPYLRYKTFSILQNKNVLSKNDISLYYSIQLLDGHTFDKQQIMKGFETIKALAKNYKNRENILNRLKHMTPLPGKVFSLKTKSALVITKAISKYLPEYIDNYSTTCLEHLDGSKYTKGGNPATYCHELFNMAKNSDILPNHKSTLYKKIMNSWKI
jgi:hypothetical protein